MKKQRLRAREHAHTVRVLQHHLGNVLTAPPALLDSLDMVAAALWQLDPQEVEEMLAPEDGDDDPGNFLLNAFVDAAYFRAVFDDDGQWVHPDDWPDEDDVEDEDDEVA